MVALGTNGWNTEPLGGMMDLQHKIDVPETSSPLSVKPSGQATAAQLQEERSIIEVENVDFYYGSNHGKEGDGIYRPLRLRQDNALTLP